MSEVGVGYVRILPSMRGFGSELSKQLKAGVSGPAKDAGEDAGKKLSTGVADGAKKGEGGVSRAAGVLGNAFSTALAHAGMRGAEALTEAIQSGLDAEVATDKLEAQLGGGAWAEQAGEVAGDLYTAGFGSSVTDTAGAVRSVLQTGLLPADATNEQIESMTGRLLTFTDVLDQDVQGSVNAVSQMLRTGMVPTAEAGFDLLTRSIQTGGDKAGDLLDTFNEYPTMFRDLGLSGATAMGLLTQGLQAGARDSDVVADALKEFSLKAKDVSAAGEGYELLGLNAERMAAKFAAGGAGAGEVLDTVLDRLRAMPPSVERSAAAFALFGSPGEDLAGALYALDPSAATVGLGDLEGATDDLGSAYDNASTKIETFRRQALMKVTEYIGSEVVPRLTEMFEWAQKNPAAWQALAAVVGTVATAAFVSWAAGVVASVAHGVAAVARFGVGVARVSASVVTASARFTAGVARGSARAGAAVARGGATAARGLGRFASGFRNAQAAESAFSGRLGTLGGRLRSGVNAIGRFASATVRGVGRAATAFARLSVQAAQATARVIAAGARMAAQAAVATARVAAQIAIQIARWVALGVQAMLNAARIAVAWLISLGPIAIVGAAVIALVALIIANWDTVVQWTRTAFKWVTDAIGTAINWVKANWPLLLAILTGPIGLAVLAIVRHWDTIKAGFTAVKDWISGRITDIVGFFTGLPGRLSSAAGDLFGWIGDSFKGAINTIVGLWNRLSFPSFTIGGWDPPGPGPTVPSYTVGGWSLPDIPYLARGAIVTGPTVAMVGEGSEPEAVAPLSRLEAMIQAAIIDVGVLDRPSSGSAPVGFVLDVTGGPPEMVRMVSKWIRGNAGGDVQAALGGYGARARTRRR